MLRGRGVIQLAVAIALATPVMGAPSSAVAGSEPAPQFRRAPCPADVFAPDVAAECGFVSVPENRTRPGRTIEVAAAVIRAVTPRPKPDPIVFLDGGPSFGAISPFALDVYLRGARFAADRDLILVDTRGTGLSRPRLGCPEFDEASVAAFYSKPLVDTTYAEDMAAATAACRNRLTADGIDLAAYNSAESAADLDDLRRALGYDDWNLLAISADGVLGLTYMRLYPDHIRSVILDSPVSPQHLGELDFFRGSRDLLEKIFAGCAANAECDATYPGIRDAFYAKARRLQQRPVVVEVPDFLPGPIRFQVDGVEFYLDSLGAFPGDRKSPESIHLLLSDMWRTTHGDLPAVFQEHLGTGPFVSFTDESVAEGKTASYLCRDVIGFITPSDIEQAAQEMPELAPMLLDPANGLPFGPAGCTVWDVGLADEAQHLPVSSAIPTLVLAGEYDPAVPPYITRQIPPTLPNSVYFEFPAGSHLQLASYNLASPCARSIAAQFLAAPARQPNGECLSQLAPFDFTPPTN